MKKISGLYHDFFQRFFPSPFMLAIILTVIVFIASIGMFISNGNNGYEALINSFNSWEKGFWNGPMLEFAFQMMVMLTFGHALAISPFFERKIKSLLKHFHSNASLAAVTALLACLSAWFNWGFGLIIGAVMARKSYEYAASNNIPVNYPLIAAAGYSGLMIWHQGISGSSLSKVSEYGHLQKLMEGMIPENVLSNLPDLISYTDTVFSWQNLFVSILSLVFIPSFFYILGRTEPVSIANQKFQVKFTPVQSRSVSGIEAIEDWPFLGKIIGMIIFVYLVFQYFILPEKITFAFPPNLINFFLLALIFWFHGSLKKIQHAIDDAIGGSAGILLQFPFYFGIMGLMKDSGMVQVISRQIVEWSSPQSLPFFTFINSAIVNFFVPSGGGQWAIQAPIIIQSCIETGSDLSKNILAFAYGDQLTNMLQPFWAIPLLGITKLPAKDILPYSTMLMFIGVIIFSLGILLF